MPLTADLGTIELQAEQVTDLAEDKVGFDDVDKKEDMQKSFLASEAGKKIQEKLVALKDDTTLTAEGRKQKLEELAKGFFVIGDNDTEKIQRLVGSDGKQYLRIAYGDELFDISLDGADIPGLIKGLIDWYLERMATVVNEGVEEENQITFRYEAEKLVIKQTQEELAGLQKQVSPTPSVAAVGGTGLRDRVKQKWHDMTKGVASFDDVKSATRDRVSSKFAIVTSAIGSFAGISSMMATKDPAKAAASKGKWDAFTEKVSSFKNTIASAFGMGPKTPPPAPVA